MGILFETTKISWHILKETAYPLSFSFDNDLGLDQEGHVAPDGYAALKWLVYESGLDLRELRYHMHSANPVAAEQIRGLLDNYLKYLKGQ